MFGRSLILFSLFGLLAACGPGEDDTRPNNVIFTTNNGMMTNNSTTGTNNGSTGTNNTTVVPETCVPECDAGMRCINKQCVDDSLLSICEEPEDLGVVDTTMTFSGDGSSSFYADAITSTCGFDDVYSAAEYAVKFQVDAPSVARFAFTSSASLEWILEVRQDCQSPEGAQCVNRLETDFAVEPGQDYWVIMQPAAVLDRAEVSWTLEFEQFVCTPGTMCDGDNLYTCDGGQAEYTYPCGTGCANDACVGDSCETAYEVTAPMTLTGETDAFSSNLNFAANESCMNTESPGPEIVLSFPGLTAGQVVTIDASMMDTNNNSIFVLPDCSDTAMCLANNDLGDYLEWTVEADGDYIVVIDKANNNGGEYMYAIDIQ